MWITNGGFADLYIVFAKVDENGQTDKNLSAFIVERSYEGITMNEPEHKMGIKGSIRARSSSTTAKCRSKICCLIGVMASKLPFNILNIGRIKLGVATIGGSKEVINQAVRYANERKQFKTAIAQFGAIKHKLAEMAIKVYASETASYRAGQKHRRPD